MKCSFFLLSLFLIVLYTRVSLGYDVYISDADDARQFCSGMWSGKDTYINVSFTPHSQGQVSLVIYEWADADFIGKASPQSSLPKTYICTSDAVKNSLCSLEELGRFIINLPSDKSLNSTSIWTASVALNTTGGSPANQTAGSGSLWDNPAGNPVLPSSENPSAFRRFPLSSLYTRETVQYTAPLKYPVTRTGYYCTAVVPVSTTNNDIVIHPTFKGSILFQNVFKGHLSATEYPKLQLYLALVLAYSVLGCAWGILCYKHRTELLPVQYYLSSLVAFVMLQTLASWTYQRYLNSHGHNLPSTVFLFVVSFLDAGRNSLSLFLLLIVSLGLSVVRDSLGSAMTRCWVLAVTHFVFGVLYAIGIVELELESTSALVLLLFIVPLAFTLSVFLFWILFALNSTTLQLQNRKQFYKLAMFRKLYYILLSLMAMIALFFVISSLSFSNRLQQNYAADTWQTRWLLLDGYLALLYLVAFSGVIYIWRPTENNRRLAMSEEIAQDEPDGAEYDLSAMEMNAPENGNQNESILPGRVVFEIGDDDHLHQNGSERVTQLG